MQENEIEELLIEVTTGKRIFEYDLTSEVFAVEFPNINDRDKARIIYSKVYRELSSKGLPNIDEMRLKIQQLKFLPDDLYQRMSIIQQTVSSNEKAIEQTTSKSQKYELKFENEGLYKELNDLKRQEDVFFDNTVEAKAEEARINYLVSRCILCGDELDTKYWNTYQNFNQSSNGVFLQAARLNFMIMSFGISADKIRFIARTDEWRSRWKTAKNTGTAIFDGSISSWDKNKTSICYWSDFYDSIYGHPEPPPNKIVNNDDELFEWIREVNRRNTMKGKTGSNNAAGGQTTQVNTPYKIRPKKPADKLFAKIQ